MKTIRITLYVMLLAVAAGCSSDGTSSNKTSNQSDDKEVKIDLSLSGEELFSKHCKICHGIRGNLELNGAKDLNKSTLSLDERINIITNGKNAMTPFRKILSKEEIQRVATYSESFAK